MAGAPLEENLLCAEHALKCLDEAAATVAELGPWLQGLVGDEP